MKVVRDMSDRPIQENDAKRAYAVGLQAKARSRGSCSFCWFVLAVYPTLRGMPERDADTFRLHLEKAHGLRGEVEP